MLEEARFEEPNGWRLEPFWNDDAAGRYARKAAEAAWTVLKKIPPEQLLWRVVHPTQVVDGKLTFPVFRDLKGLSFDLAIFTNFERTRLGLYLDRQRHKDSMIVQLPTAAIRSVGGHVLHFPTGRSHGKHYDHAIALPHLVSECPRASLGEVSKVLLDPTHPSFDSKKQREAVDKYGQHLLAFNLDQMRRLEDQAIVLTAPP